MITILRYAVVGTAGFFATLPILQSPSAIFPLINILLTVAWLVAGRKIKFLHRIVIPIYTVLLLVSFLYNANPISSILVYTFLLSAWELDGIYLDGKGVIDKKSEKKLLIPLLVNGAISLISALAVYFLTQNQKLSIGFWPLILVVILLIISLRRLIALFQQ